MVSICIILESIFSSSCISKKLHSLVWHHREEDSTVSSPKLSPSVKLAIFRISSLTRNSTYSNKDIFSDIYSSFSTLFKTNFMSSHIVSLQDDPLPVHSCSPTGTEEHVIEEYARLSVLALKCSKPGGQSALQVEDSCLDNTGLLDDSSPIIFPRSSLLPGALIFGQSNQSFLFLQEVEYSAIIS
uniref:Uncharacterized protein n=1 Tax=Rhizophora mucronata TaxID=61149 RepID=A0A2P2LFX2_RHIMU